MVGTSWAGCRSSNSCSTRRTTCSMAVRCAQSHARLPVRFVGVQRATRRKWRAHARRCQRRASAQHPVRVRWLARSLQSAKRGELEDAVVFGNADWISRLMSKLQVGFCAAARGMALPQVCSLAGLTLLAGCLVSDPAGTPTSQPVTRPVEAGRAAPQASKSAGGAGTAANSGAGSSGRSESSGGAGAAGEPADTGASDQAGSAADGGAGGERGRMGANGIMATTEGKGGADAVVSSAGHAADGGVGGRWAEAGGTSGTPAAPQGCAAIGKLDLLFVVDNSNSMLREQESLKQQFPAIIQALTTGKRPTAGSKGFPPVKDIHVGIVSTDMGIPGVEFPAAIATRTAATTASSDTSPTATAVTRAIRRSSATSTISKIGQTPDPTKFANDVGLRRDARHGWLRLRAAARGPVQGACGPRCRPMPPATSCRTTSTASSRPPSQAPGAKAMCPSPQGGNQGFLRNRQIRAAHR